MESPNLVMSSSKERERNIYFVGPLVHCKCDEIGNMQWKKTAVIKTVKLWQERKIEN